MAKSTKALVKAKTKTKKPIAYQPPPERATHRFVQAPGLDPQTRQVLVHLEERVKTFHNLEDRIDELASLVTDIENHIKNATIEETWWQRLQFAVTALQKEFHDRVGLLERSFDAVQNLVCRMDRLEKRMNDFENGGTNASSND